MAAITTAAVVGAGVLMSFYGQMEAGKAAARAGELNAHEAEENARLSRERAIEDERAFRTSFRRDEGRNVAAIGASGVKQEGSPIEVLQDNAASMEHDALNIRKFGAQTAAAYQRQANMFRETGAAGERAGNIAGAATLLRGAGDTYTTGQKSGAWK